MNFHRNKHFVLKRKEGNVQKKRNERKAKIERRKQDAK